MAYENLFHDDFQRQMLELADECFKDTLVANQAEPYVHSTYELHLSKARAALVLFAEGNCRLAEAMENAFHDSNESMLYYLSNWDEEDLIQQFSRGHGPSNKPLLILFAPVYPS